MAILNAAELACARGDSLAIKSIILVTLAYLLMSFIASMSSLSDFSVSVTKKSTAARPL